MHWIFSHSAENIGKDDWIVMECENWILLLSEQTEIRYLRMSWCKEISYFSTLGKFQQCKSTVEKYPYTEYLPENQKCFNKFLKIFLQWNIWKVLISDYRPYNLVF